MSLGERLRDRRIQRKLTNGQVAEYLKVSKAHITEMEKGRSKPSLELLAKIATYYQTTTDWLLGQPGAGHLPGEVVDRQMGYSRAESSDIMTGLPDELRLILTSLAVALKDSEMQNRERDLGEFIIEMLGDVAEKYGEEAEDELTIAIQLFVRSGDGSGIRAWLNRYFRGTNFLPDQE